MFVLSPNTTATRRTPISLLIVELAPLMGYEELKKYLQTQNIPPVVYEAELLDCCNRRGL